MPEAPICPPAPRSEGGPFDPTGMFMPGVVPVTSADWWRKRIAINISFLWLLFPVLDLAGSHPSLPRALSVALAVVTYIALYNRIPRERPPAARTRDAVPTLLTLAVITTVLTLADRSSWSLLFVFTAISGAMRLPYREAALWIFLCTGLTAATNVIASSDAGSNISLTATTLAIGFMMFAFRRLLELNHELMSAREEVARLAVSEERLRFSRDLHDLLGHGLSVISVKAELAERLLATDPPGAAEHVRDIRKVARDALGEVREAVSGYRRPTLASELSGARLALTAAGIEARLEGTDVELDPEVEAVLAWAVREGTTNVIRHSGARTCRIEVQPGPAAASAVVTDDGRVAQAGEEHVAEPTGDGGVAEGPERVGTGLAGLRERVERLAGALEAGPAAEGGFRLRVSVPLRSPPA